MVDEHDKFMGTLESADIRRGLDSTRYGKTQPIDISTPWCVEDATLERVLQQLGSGNDQIVVIDGDGRIIGGVTKDDVVASLITSPIE